jgi:hypothetical protein
MEGGDSPSVSGGLGPTSISPSKRADCREVGESRSLRAVRPGSDFDFRFSFSRTDPRTDPLASYRYGPAPRSRDVQRDRAFCGAV